jgi:putative ABC transport system ATP-binding protein
VSTDTPILESRNLVRRVKIESGDRTVVDDFTFAFLPGRIYSIMGPSGAGKSSTLRLLNRLDEPSSGEVLFEGQDYRTMAPCTLRRRIGYLFQIPYLFPGTVKSNLLYANGDLDDTRIGELLETASFDPTRREEPAANLSVGEKQRVALSRLLATDPHVILLDEPTAALDPAHTANIEAAVRQIAADRKRTVIMVSHDPAQAVRMGGHGLLMVAGRLEEHGPVDRLVHEPQTAAGRRYRDKELT